MNIDKLFTEVVGELGHQQIVYCLLFSLMNSYCAFQMLQYKFVVRDTSEFLCYPKVEGKNEPEVAIPNKCTSSDGFSHSVTRYKFNEIMALSKDQLGVFYLRIYGPNPFIFVVRTSLSTLYNFLLLFLKELPENNISG